MRIASKTFFLLAAVATSAFAAGPSWDTTGNGLLNGVANGVYYFRQVIYVTDGNGNTSAGYTLYGNIDFVPSSGTYTIPAGAMYISSSGGSSPTTTAITGTYSLSASGYGFMSSPLISGTSMPFLVADGIMIGSDTESGTATAAGYNDLFIAAPYSSSLNNASLSGSYTIDGFFPGSNPTIAADLTYQLSPNGAGSLGTVSVSGTAGTGQALSQISGGVKYNFVNGVAIVTFPTNTSANFYSGQEYMYISPDANFVFGGSPTGFDMFVGVRNAASGANTPLSGLYYEAGLDENQGSLLDSYYGVFNAFQGNIIGHERILYSGSGLAGGETYPSSYPTSIANSYKAPPGNDPSASTQYTIGQDGIRIGVGVGQYLSISVAAPYTPPAPTTSVYVDPTGVVNTASSAPYTAGVSPGDFITLYNGVNLAASTVFAPPGAFPTTLGNVKVLVDGIAAPLYYVSATQVSFLIPYAASTFPIASIVVNNNGVTSNTVTTYVHQTTPGVFTSSPVGGIGYAAMLDFPASGGSYFIVGANNPVQPGDTIALYLTGLGTPFPPNGDGQLGGTSCVTGVCLVNGVDVKIGGTDVGTLAFAGLAPGLAGLYQINFTVPASIATGTVYSLDIAGQVTESSGATVGDSYTFESLIPVGSGSASAVSTSPQPVPALHRTLPGLRPAPLSAPGN